jgi:hypothetical protein
MDMEIALLIGALGILGFAANRWGVDSRDADVSLFKAPNSPAREMLVAFDEPSCSTEICCRPRRAHLRLRLHRAA